MLSVRSIEFLALADSFYDAEDSLLLLWGNAMIKEGVFLLLYLLVGGSLFALIGLFLKKAEKALFTGFFILLLSFYLIGTQYYYSANLLLDRLIFYFSFSELMVIANSEAGNLSGDFFAYYTGTICIAVLLLFLYFKELYFKRARLIRLGLFFFLLTAGIAGKVIFSDYTLNTRYTQIATSKPYFFLKSIIDNISFEKEKEDHFAIIKRFREANNWKPSKHQQQYPFIHDFEEEQGNINHFFASYAEVPNVVMVFCEGLSSEFSGEHARFGSMTPHLDSIYKMGLYWPNTISNTDRTHGVFANVLASMPHGFERGALNLKLKKFPEHYSLAKFLVSNGYDASFNYGGWAYFDNYEPFMKMNYVDKIYSEKFFKENYTVNEFSSEEFSWGIHDKELFELYLNLNDTHRTKSPFFDVILNQSLHSPYVIPNQEKYIQKAKERFIEVNGNKKFFEKHKKAISTMYYQDEAIGELMRKYKKKPGYENTLFVFVGDHNVNALPNENRLQAHYVPLVIYSPRLKAPKQFDDLVAHTDIPISLVKLIEPSIDETSKPLYSHWLGKGLSTRNKFSSDHSIYVGSFSGDITGLIRGDTLLLYDEMYQIEKSFSLKKLDLEQTKLLFQRQLDDYKYLNRFVLENDRLMQEQDVLSFSNRKAALFFPE